MYPPLAAEAVVRGGLRDLLVDYFRPCCRFSGFIVGGFRPVRRCRSMPVSAVPWPFRCGARARVPWNAGGGVEAYSLQNYTKCRNDRHLCRYFANNFSHIFQSVNPKCPKIRQRLRVLASSVVRNIGKKHGVRREGNTGTAVESARNAVWKSAELSDAECGTL